MIPYGRQSISDDDVAAVVEVLRSDWLTQGPAVERFEAAVAEYCQVAHAVAVSSGTAALHIAAKAAGLAKGDVLWTSPNTFVASANCAFYCGASADFVDIDPRTYNMDAGLLEARLEAASREGRLPAAVVPVHFAGQSADMRRIKELAGRYGFMVIEDASHAVGGGYLDGRVGSCAFSDMACFSFHPVKIVTTGEGGMVLTNDDELDELLREYRTHGITKDESRMVWPSDGPWYYQQLDLGFNYRLTDIQAALGTSQMRRVDEFVARRRELADRYDEMLAGLPVTVPWRDPDAASAWHLYVIRLQLDAIDRSRRDVFESLREAGIGVQVHYIPVHLQPYYRALGFSPGDFPEAEAYYEEAISIPMYADLSRADQETVVRCLEAALG
jgi:UDP-4-amino-4,6-dideoxy-N-acetyl-beta-L-altrosamine transaminase